MQKTIVYLLSILLVFLNLSCDRKPEIGTSIPDAELKTWQAVYPNVSAIGLKYLGQEELEYADGQKARQINYGLVKGRVVSLYPVIVKADGSVEECFWEQGKRDIKEYDPKFRDIFERVEQKVTARMKAENIQGLGSCHVYWSYKKEYLKKEGIEWKTPAELNPGTFFD